MNLLPLAHLDVSDLFLECRFYEICVELLPFFPTSKSPNWVEFRFCVMVLFCWEKLIKKEAVLLGVQQMEYSN